MYHTIGIWTAAPTGEMADLFREKAKSYPFPNGNLFSVTQNEDGSTEVIREWLTLEDANTWKSWIESSATSGLSGPMSITVVEVPE